MSNRSKRVTRHRKLSFQNLERRQLMAGDFGTGQSVPRHNEIMPADVNDDQSVSSSDALFIINWLGKVHDDSTESIPKYHDVNDDGHVSSMDVLRVINWIRRGGPSPLDIDDDTPEVRSINGTGNHLNDPTMGSAGTMFMRDVAADYVDGVSLPPGGDRLSAREISNIMAVQTEPIPSRRRLSDLVWQWGQFLDHDITLVMESKSVDHAFNIAVPMGDEYFDPTLTGEQEIHMTRSMPAEGSGIDSPRQQINVITAYIDGSMIYGSDAATMNSLRSFIGGRLLTSDGDMMPVGEDGRFQAGDVRANEQNGLTAMHTLWVREHNRIADEILAANPLMSEEDIFQKSRSIVIGEIQSITFNEYLPTLLGVDAIDGYQGYDSTINPSISNLFATAAFRYGHTSLTSEFQRLDNDGNLIEDGNILLRDAFFNPAEVIKVGIEPYLKGFASNVSQEIDNFIIDDVRNFLFGQPGSGGFDLASLNIQRGRDHGLPDYNSAREQYGLVPVADFSEISSDPSVQAKLKAAYETVDDIDVWVGMLAEDHVAGSSVGELIRFVLIDQFTRLRNGDRFWFESTFDGVQLDHLNSTTLAAVIQRNTDLSTIQDNAFIVPESNV